MRDRWYSCLLIPCREGTVFAVRRMMAESHRTWYGVARVEHAHDESVIRVTDPTSTGLVDLASLNGTILQKADLMLKGEFI